MPKPKEIANVPRKAPLYFGSVYSATRMAASGVLSPRARPWKSLAIRNAGTELPRMNESQPRRAGIVVIRWAFCRPKRVIRIGDMKLPTIPITPTTEAVDKSGIKLCKVLFY